MGRERAGWGGAGHRRASGDSAGASGRLQALMSGGPPPSSTAEETGPERVCGLLEVTRSVLLTPRLEFLWARNQFEIKKKKKLDAPGSERRNCFLFLSFYLLFLSGRAGSLLRHVDSLVALHGLSCPTTSCKVSAPQPGIKLVFPALEGRLLTTGPPGKSLKQFFKLR